MPVFTMPKWIATWNRKIHIYLGLYFLFFLWLFSFSGLLLNHPHWAFAQSWPSRTETSSVHSIQAPTARESPARAEELLAQLDIAGEIEQIGTPAENMLNIQVVRPGRTVNISADFSAGQATVKEIEVNGWGIVNALHEFNGVPTWASTTSRNISTRVRSVPARPSSIVNCASRTHPRPKKNLARACDSRECGDERCG